MPGSRRLSQRISEGDGIAIIVRVSDVGSARAAEEQGAKAIAIDRAIAGIRDATSLPLLWTGEGPSVDTDALTIRPGDEADYAELETVCDVRDDEELVRALEELDPEMFLLSARHGNDGDDPLETVLELLPDVPAGKLAIADVEVATRTDVLALERAGIDAVLVDSALHVAELTAS
jgi:hypothetical protein